MGSWAGAAAGCGWAAACWPTQRAGGKGRGEGRALGRGGERRGPAQLEGDALFLFFISKQIFPISFLLEN